jgi:glycosyltransferase involved in cell wall biosynthesis
VVTDAIQASEHRPPAASVVIPHYNDLANLDRCLDLLSRQDLAEPFEVIVVDNASPMPLERVAAAVRGRARLVQCLEKGAGPARNAGVAAARADRLAFIDSDCRPDPDWLRQGLAALERFDFVGGHVRVDVADPARLTDVEAFESVFAFRFKEYIEKKRFTGTGNLFAGRRIFEAVGGFKAQVSEDVEWSHRAQDGGFRLGYEPRAVVGHPARRSWDELTRKWRRTTAEAWSLACTRPGGQLLYLARSWLVLASAAPHVLKVLRAPQLTTLRDRLGAIKILIKLRIFRFLEAHRLVLGRGGDK